MSEPNGDPRSGALRILVADDTPDIRVLLRAALSLHADLEVVGEAVNGAEAVELTLALHPNAVLLDLAMPVMDGIQATGEILKKCPGTKIVILSGFSKDRMEAEALAAGAEVFLEKGVSPSEIAQTLRAVCGRIAQPPAEILPDERDEELLRTEVSAGVGSAPTLALAFDGFCAALRHHVDFERAGFAVARDGSFQVVAVSGTNAELLPVGSVVPIGDATREALANRTPLCVEDTSEHPDETNRHLYERGIRSYVTIPVVVGGEVQALIGLSAVEPRVFSPRAVSLTAVAVHEAAGVLNVLAVLDREQREAKERAEADEHQLEWSRMIRHDLRSPLTVINGVADLLEHDWDEFDDAKKRDLLEAIGRNARHMTKLLTNTEEIEEIERGLRDRNAGAFDLRAVVEQTMGDVLQGQSRPWSFNAPPGLPPAFGDEAGQRRVFSNLLENALKYASDDLPIDVFAELRDGMITVTVRDHGPGIAQDDMPRLFCKFSRLESAATHSPDAKGSGLGLYICRSLVEADGGRIAVESPATGGAVFSYTVPVAASSSLDVA